MSAADDRNIHSPRLPGGDLVSAVLDREVMRLADRGGASGLVGRRWADLCAEHVDQWVGQRRPIPGRNGDSIVVERVVRLDDTPAIAAAAAKRALQNPDFMLIGKRDGRPVLQAADAKFSVETARSKQVSPSVVAGLLELGDLVNGLMGDLGSDPELVDGVFLSPDFRLTHLMLRRRHGIVRVTVEPEQVAVLAAPPGAFFALLEGASAMAPLAAVDTLPLSIDESLLAALYYFRLARAGVGCWLDSTGPLLVYHDRVTVDEAAVVEQAEERAAQAKSAFTLIKDWYAEVQTVRDQRAAVDQVTALPFMSRDIRELVTRATEGTGLEPPSVSQVRRRLGAWYRGQIREQVGPIYPPVPNFPGLLRELSRIGASLSPALREEADRVVAELIELRAAASIQMEVEAIRSFSDAAVKPADIPHESGRGRMSVPRKAPSRHCRPNHCGLDSPARARVSATKSGER